MNIKSLFIMAATIFCGQSIHAGEYNFSFKNKSSRSVQIEIVQQLKTISGPTNIPVGDMFTATIDIKEPTKVHIHYCPDDTWCKTNKPERMTARFTPNKPIHVSFDGKKLRPQLKRLKNVGAGDIILIK